MKIKRIWAVTGNSSDFAIENRAGYFCGQQDNLFAVPQSKGLQALALMCLESGGPKNHRTKT